MITRIWKPLTSDRGDHSDQSDKKNTRMQCVYVHPFQDGCRVPVLRNCEIWDFLQTNFAQNIGARTSNVQFCLKAIGEEFDLGSNQSEREKKKNTRTAYARERKRKINLLSGSEERW